MGTAGKAREPLARLLSLSFVTSCFLSAGSDLLLCPGAVWGQTCPLQRDVFVGCEMGPSSPFILSGLLDVSTLCMSRPVGVPRSAGLGSCTEVFGGTLTCHDLVGGSRRRGAGLSGAVLGFCIHVLSSWHFICWLCSGTSALGEKGRCLGCWSRTSGLCRAHTRTAQGEWMQCSWAARGWARAWFSPGSGPGLSGEGIPQLRHPLPPMWAESTGPSMLALPTSASSPLQELWSQQP